MKNRNSVCAKLAAFVLAASMSLALASCGSSDSSNTNSGTVNIPASSEAAVSSEAPADSSAAESAAEAPAESTAETPAESTAETPAESTAENAPSTDIEPEVPATASFDEKAKFKYNGATFTIGEKFDGIKDQLGNQAKPSSVAKPCAPDAHDVDVYYYPGLTIQVNFEGTIIDITLSEESVPGTDATTASGLKLGDSRETAKKFLGEPSTEDEFSLSYTEGTKYLSIYDRESGIYIISLSDTALPY